MVPNKIAILAASSLMTVSAFAFAHSGATGIVKQRMEAMKDVGKQMKIIGEMIKGTAAFDGLAAKKAADTISEHAAEIQNLFPEGSTQSPSEALPAIWSEWDEFIAIADEMKFEAEKLSTIAKTASNTQEIKAQFMSVGKTCSGCHERYRLKK